MYDNQILLTFLQDLEIFIKQNRPELYALIEMLTERSISSKMFSHEELHAGTTF